MDSSRADRIGRSLSQDSSSIFFTEVDEPCPSPSISARPHLRLLSPIFEAEESCQKPLLLNIMSTESGEDDPTGASPLVEEPVTVSEPLLDNLKEEAQMDIAELDEMSKELSELKDRAKRLSRELSILSSSDLSPEDLPLDPENELVQDKELDSHMKVVKDQGDFRILRENSRQVDPEQDPQEAAKAIVDHILLNAIDVLNSRDQGDNQADLKTENVENEHQDEGDGERNEIQLTRKKISFDVSNNEDTEAKDDQNPEIDNAQEDVKIGTITEDPGATKNDEQNLDRDDQIDKSTEDIKTKDHLQMIPDHNGTLENNNVQEEAEVTEEAMEDTIAITENSNEAIDHIKEDALNPQEMCTSEEPFENITDEDIVQVKKDSRDLPEHVNENKSSEESMVNIDDRESNIEQAVDPIQDGKIALACHKEDRYPKDDQYQQGKKPKEMEDIDLSEFIRNSARNHSSTPRDDDTMSTNKPNQCDSKDIILDPAQVECDPEFQLIMAKIQKSKARQRERQWQALYPDLCYEGERLQRDRKHGGPLFWQMPFRNNYYHQIKGETLEDDCNLDPHMFAPTGNIYSYFQRRKLRPIPIDLPTKYQIKRS